MITATWMNIVCIHFINVAILVTYILYSDFETNPKEDHLHIFKKNLIN